MNRKGKSTQFDKELGANIKALRLNNNMSQDKLGAKLGVTFQQLQKYENGSNRICPEKLFELGLIFDIDIRLLAPKKYNTIGKEFSLQTPVKVKKLMKQALSNINKALDYDNPANMENMNTDGEVFK